MRKRSRILAVAAVVAVLSAVAATFAINANADPDLYAKGYNGRVVEQHFKVGNAGCGVEVAVDLHRGYLAPDSPSAFRGGVVRVSKLGANTLRTQVDLIRVGAVIGGPDTDDKRPSKDSEVRDNGLLPYDPLNSDYDYPGNVTNMVAYSNWLTNAGTDTDEQFQVRAVGAVRCTNGTAFTFSVLSDPAGNDAA